MSEATPQTPAVTVHQDPKPASPPGQASPVPPAPTATERATKPKTVTVKDDLGRTLVVRRLSAMDRLNLFEVAGQKMSQNQGWMGMIAVAASCVRIDDEDVQKPITILEMKALVQRLEQEGLDAIQLAYVEHFGVVLDSDDTSGLASVKN